MPTEAKLIDKVVKRIEKKLDGVADEIIALNWLKKFFEGRALRAEAKVKDREARLRFVRNQLRNFAKTPRADIAAALNLGKKNWKED